MYNNIIYTKAIVFFSFFLNLFAEIFALENASLR